jgi:hypothetical protein
MPKISNHEININDVKEFVESESDFAFELRVLDKLRELSFVCEHSGTYEDPVSKKVREFDILARISKGNFNINLSVECKNLKKNFPLLVHCTSRTDAESYHEIILIDKRSSHDRWSLDISTPAEVIRLYCENSIYTLEAPTGKSTDQIYREQSSNSLASNDSGVFEKISQAVNSSYKLIQEAKERATFQQTFVCPVLVIPEGTLWTVIYDSTKEHDWEVVSASSVSYYLGKEWETQDHLPIQRISYTLSHLEIVTASYLEQFVENFLAFESIFKDNY